MSIGLLLILNFISIPFWQEAEELGKKMGKFPPIFNVIQLKNTLSQRWFKLYCVFLTIFLTVALAPSASGKTYAVSYTLIIGILCVQLVLWILVYFKISRFNK